MEKKTEKELLGAVEAILFAMGESVSLSKIASAIGKDETEAKRLLEELKKQYQKKERGIQLIELEDSYQLCTKPELYDYLIQVAKQPKKHVLTDVLLETLAIVAYKQPVTKIEIEKIRGVKSDHAVNKLVEYDLVCEVGRLDAPGYLAQPKNFCDDLECSRWRSFQALHQSSWKILKKRQSGRSKIDWMSDQKRFRWTYSGTSNHTMN